MYTCINIKLKKVDCCLNTRKTSRFSLTLCRFIDTIIWLVMKNLKKFLIAQSPDINTAWWYWKINVADNAYAWASTSTGLSTFTVNERDFFPSTTPFTVVLLQFAPIRLSLGTAICTRAASISAIERKVCALHLHRGHSGLICRC